MNTHTPVEAFADLLGTLVRDHETTDVVARLVDDCATLLHADAAALLVEVGRGLELLAATSHRAAELEVYQAQQQSGPCVDVIATGEQLSIVGAAMIAERWPDVGSAVVTAGFDAVYAFPMTWRGRTIGGLNVFLRRSERLDDSALRLGQYLADVATLALAQPTDLTDDDLAERVRLALDGRATIERAKGVLAHTYGVDMASAYERLLNAAEVAGATLTQTAARVIREARRR
ncbi:GAF and ANTAR domain-containing protein [Cellulomonas sp. URHD0024]|uniref:GAF and ANTAR domain-containing protein n=1 Tax=Cellulomonas sp. URHD0024 TaxID=1302620 RepID=UPI0003F9933C|nr:GAF and ANTAR domain-containing protein [Cellulomonas sp. URHD0024]